MILPRGGGAIAYVLKSLAFGAAAGLAAFALEASRLAYVPLGQGYPTVQLHPLPILAASVTRGPLAGATAALSFLGLALPSLGHELLSTPVYPLAPLPSVAILTGLAVSRPVAWRIAAAAGGWALYLAIHSSLSYWNGYGGYALAFPGDLAAGLLVAALALTPAVVLVSRPRLTNGVPLALPPQTATRAGLVAGLLLLAGWLRVDGLMEMDMFVDEAIWLSWAARAAAGDLTGLMAPWVDDRRTPLFGWLAAAAAALARDDLEAVRALSALAGVGTCLALMLLGKGLFGWGHGLAAGLLYAVNPMAVFFDRIAVDDALLGLVGTLALLSSLGLARRPSLGAAALCGAALAAAMWTKLTAVLLIPGPLLALALLGRGPWGTRMLLCGLAWAIAAALLAPLVLMPIGPAAGAIADHTMSPAELAALPTNRWRQHLVFMSQTWQWAVRPALALVLVASLAVAVLRPSRRALFLAFFVLGPTCAFILLGRGLHARYLLPALAVACALLGWWLAETAALLRAALLRRPLAANAAGVSLALAVALPSALSAREVAARPETAWLPTPVRIEYREQTSSGFGARAVAGYLRQQAAAQPIVLLYRPSGHMERAVLRHLRGAKGVVVVATHTVGLGAAPLEEVLEWTEGNRAVFFMVNEPRRLERGRAREIIEAELPQAHRALTVPRPRNRSWVDLYRVDPS